MHSEKEQLFKTLKVFKCFSELGTNDLIAIIRNSVVRTFRKDKVLYYQGDPSEAVYFIISGKIRKIKYRADESSMLIGIYQSGTWLGLNETVIEGLYLTDARVEERSEVLYILKNNFIRMLELPLFEKYILKTVAKEYYSLHGHLDSHTPLKKIVKYFQANIETFGKKDKKSNNYIINITQENLADSISFTRETVNKHLKYLEEKGIIKISRGRIEIIKLDELLKRDI